MLKVYVVIGLGFTVATIQLINSGCSSSHKRGELARAPTAAPEELRNLYSLKEVLEKVKEGRGRKQAELKLHSPEEEGALKQKAEEFIAFRNGHMSLVDQTRFTNECSKPDHGNVYCYFQKKYVEPDTDDIPSEGHGIRLRMPKESLKAYGRYKRGVYANLRNKLKEGQFQDFEEYNFRVIREVLEPFKTLVPLEKSFEQVSGNACQNVRLSYFLIAKVEEFLPDPTMRQKAIKLYDKVARCKHPLYQPAAKYRLSLLRIWEDRCQDVLSDLEFLTEDDKRKTYRSRGLYWTYYCQNHLGNATAAKSAAEDLLKNHPFSLHTLLVDKTYAEQLRARATKPDSDVSFRKGDEQVDNAILAAEGLLLLKKGAAFGLAREILSSITTSEVMEDVPPEVQLYLALLFNRARDNVGKFKIMAPLFRDYPKMISHAALQLYYPLRNLNNKVMESMGLDEFLVVSLIRQESAFNEMARSDKGALGLMQILPRTARVRPRVLFNPEVNVRLGSKFFHRLLERYKGDTELALAAYNAGPLVVDKWKVRYKNDNRILMIDLFPYRETSEYVAHIARNYYWYTVLYPNKGNPSASPSAEETQNITAQLGGVFKLFGS